MSILDSTHAKSLNVVQRTPLVVLQPTPWSARRTAVLWAVTALSGLAGALLSWSARVEFGDTAALRAAEINAVRTAVGLAPLVPLDARTWRESLSPQHLNTMLVGGPGLPSEVPHRRPRY